ncbi:MAG TPA: hypothetical protein VKV15_06875 [Bryobacteraceae bacterium]|nr:hypothetical protein [Bryobacteraceae bacterium]
MKSAKATILGLSIIVMMTAAAPFTCAQAARVRWDIISVNFVASTVAAGGMASATANDGSYITMTGSGTFVAPGGGDGTSSAVTGGGNWITYTPGGVATGSGTYQATGLVRWAPAPYTPGAPPPLTDLIEPSEVQSTGLAVLRISYSDGQFGILVVSCTGSTAPAFMFEGITATKQFKDYKSPVPPVPGVNGNRTLFHIE